MKTSLRKLRGFALHGHVEHKEKRDLRSSAKLDELAHSCRDMQDMRDCYDSLLSAASATTNSAYEFSESLREMGSCLLEKTSLNDDEESGKVLLMLGKVQFELDELIDTYRSHVFQTITIPSESLLNELRTVEEMKRQCDEKRDVYEYMSMKHTEKGRSKSGKGANFSAQQIQAARDEYDEEATLFVFRLKSLKQGQSRSLLTQAARHHAAQSCFFKKALKSLESVEPHVKSITERQHIDYKFSGLEDDHVDFCSDDDSSYDDGELSFDYGQNDQEEVSTSRKLMELDQPDLTFPKVVNEEFAKENLNFRHPGSFALNKERMGTQSAPLFAEKKFEAATNLKEFRPSLSRKLHTYVLPTPTSTPLDTRRSISSGSAIPVSHTKRAGANVCAYNVSHSSPLNSKKIEETSGEGKFSGSIAQNAPPVLKDSNINTEFNRLPAPLTEGLLFAQPDPFAASYSNRYKRQAFSGPLSNKPWSSGPLLRNPVSSSPPKVSTGSSPTFISPPKISELHELPRPPISSISKSQRSLGWIGYSGPLLSRSRENSAMHKSTVSDAASRLPTPGQALSRSFSIPSSGSKVTELQGSNHAETPHGSDIPEDITSPPLTPVSFPNTQL